MQTESREQIANNWLTSRFESSFELHPITGDASFRKYSRVYLPSNQTFILMDSNPESNNNEAFIKTTNLFRRINVPKIYAELPEEGFFLITDFGDETFNQYLNPTNSVALYQSAIDSLIQMQSLSEAEILPEYSETELYREINLFRDWYRDQYLGKPLTEQELLGWEQLTLNVITNCIAQEQVFVHRDFHSRNLMVTKDNTLGIIDYQDALYGPITYDLVSLLKDAYIKLSPDDIDNLIGYYIDKGSKQLGITIDPETFKRDFDFMGVQRHLKILGIFARLSIRDKKNSYLKDIPFVLDYLSEVSDRYEELNSLKRLLKY